MIELLGLFLNAVFFFGTGYHVVVQAYPRAAAAWLAAGLAFYYTAHVVALIRRGPRDRALLTAFIALAASFLVITLPLLLTGSWLTAIWAVQAVALLWIALRLESPTLRRIAEGLLLLVLFRLVFLDFGDRFGESPPTLWPDYLRLLGDRAMQFGLPILSFGVARRLLARAPATEPAPALRVESRFALGFALVVLFAYLTLETGNLLTQFVPGFRGGGISVIWGLYALALLVAGIRHASRSLRLVGLALLGITVVKIFAVDLDQLDTMYRIVAFLTLGVVLLFAAFMYLKNRNRFSPATPKESAP